MTPQNTTAYIETPISIPPKEDGEYIVKWRDQIEMRQYGTKVKSWINNHGDFTKLRDDCVWLRPVDLSRMLEEAWDAGQMRRQQEMWHQNHDPTGNPEAPDFETFLSHLLNKEK